MVGPHACRPGAANMSRASTRSDLSSVIGASAGAVNQSRTHEAAVTPRAVAHDASVQPAPPHHRGPPEPAELDAYQQQV
jgi:hypothetical protein